MAEFDKANELIREFKGDRYIHGADVLHEAGRVAAKAGRRAVLVRAGFPGNDAYLETIRRSLREARVEMLGEIEGAAPNAPREDLYRITDEIGRADPDLVLSFGGGSTIDVTKAALVLHTLGDSVEKYFGTGLVTRYLAEANEKLLPHVAIQTAASSGAHLTKYSNITDLKTGQKKLIVDEALVPPFALFDHRVTYGSPPSLTADGALDGIAHALEVLFGAVNSAGYAEIERVARESIALVVKYLPQVLRRPEDPVGREALGLATDLGGYAIMLGGTNGGHLTSFSLVDVLSHGRACAIMNPYYTVFFALNIEEPLRIVGGIYQNAGHISEDLATLRGRDLGMAVARAMLSFARDIGFPTRLDEVQGFTDAHIERALAAARNPQLKMKLENMPVSLTSDMVDEYMGAILQAAKTGQLDLIRNVEATRPDGSIAGEARWSR